MTSTNYSIQWLLNNSLILFYNDDINQILNSKYEANNVSVEYSQILNTYSVINMTECNAELNTLYDFVDPEKLIEMVKQEAGELCESEPTSVTYLEASTTIPTSVPVMTVPSLRPDYS